MKKTKHALLILMLFPFLACAESDALKAVKSGPEVICKDHSDRLNCENAINNLIIAVKNISQLNEICLGQSSLKEKMNDETRRQCDTAKEITDYISGMSLKR